MRGSAVVWARSTLLLAVVAGIVSGWGVANVHGQTAWYEAFEGSDPSWQPDPNQARDLVVEHRRVPGAAQTGQMCEYLHLRTRQISHAVITHQVGHPRVIPELSPSVQLRSDQAGIRLLAEITLPRTRHPKTGTPIRVVLRGTNYGDVGRWQLLRVDHIPDLLANQVRLLRAQLGLAIDSREAYLSSVLLEVPGGLPDVRIWIDDLDIAGFVDVAPHSTPESTMGTVAPTPIAPGTTSSAQLSGGVLLVDGRPTLARMVEHRGEPLELLKRLGFNAVWMAGLPSDSILAEARENGLWIVCPPPHPRQDSMDGSSLPLQSPIGPELNCVMAWDLGRDLAPDDLGPTRAWAEQVRIADPNKGRPLVCHPDAALREYSRAGLLLLLGRAPLATSLELADYGTWIRHQPRIARPGTPTWAEIQTEPDWRLAEQWKYLGCDQSPLPAISPAQIRLLVFTSLTSGSRGLVFRSRTPLNANDPVTRLRALTLELMNIELSLIEPWLAAGKFTANVEGSQPGLIGALLRSDHALVLIPMWSPPGGQYCAPASSVESVSFVVPGVPEDYNAYVLTSESLQPPAMKARDSGGTRVTLDEVAGHGIVLLTQDLLAIDNLSKRVQRTAARSAELKRQIAHLRWQMVEQTTARLRQSVAPSVAAFQSIPTQRLAEAHVDLQRCDTALSSGDYAAASRFAENALRWMQSLEREAWESAARSLASPVTSPLAVTFASLPWHKPLMDFVAASRLGPNRIHGGDFEDSNSWFESGWNHLQERSGNFVTEAHFASDAAHSGQLGLRLAVTAGTPDRVPLLLESTAVWVTSPEVGVQPGQVYCIRGWVNVPQPITGSVDGLLITDSIGGEPLAERIGQTKGWKEFVLYRVATHEEQLSLRFSMTGLGEAWIDDVSIQQVEP